MSMPEPQNPFDSPESVRPAGMSGGTKVLVGLGIGCGVLGILCCGGLILFGVIFGRSVQNATSEDPATIRAVTESIVSIEIPPPLAPIMSLDWSIPFTDRKMTTMAIYADKKQEEKPENSLFLFQMDGEFTDREMLRAQFQKQMRESSQQQWEEASVEKPETIEVEINGSPAEFELGRGKVADGREIWQASGAFDGRGGPALLMMQLDTDAFTEEQARAIITSMK